MGWQQCQTGSGRASGECHGCLGQQSNLYSTIHARVSPLIQLTHHYEQQGLCCFPLTESLVYDFMKENPCKAPSFHRSLLLSISFANFHFGLDGASGVLGSARVRGCAQKHYAEKRKLVQGPPLTAEQVVALERIVLDPSRTDVDRIWSRFLPHFGVWQIAIQRCTASFESDSGHAES